MKVLIGVLFICLLACQYPSPEKMPVPTVSSKAVIDSSSISSSDIDARIDSLYARTVSVKQELKLLEAHIIRHMLDSLTRGTLSPAGLANLKRLQQRDSILKLGVYRDIRERVNKKIKQGIKTATTRASGNYHVGQVVPVNPNKPRTHGARFGKKIGYIEILSKQELCPKEICVKYFNLEGFSSPAGCADKFCSIGLLNLKKVWFYKFRWIGCQKELL